MKAEKFIATINERTEVELIAAANNPLDAVVTGEGEYHILHNGKSYKAEISSVDMADKTVSLKINGKSKTIKIQDEYDVLVKKMGLSAIVVHKISAIKAPMPGLVLSILVEPGQAVVHGEPMVILEAMKMENVIKSPGEGTVKRIVVAKGKPVDKGEILIEMA
jgi:biotin carboxyl carrier protein